MISENFVDKNKVKKEVVSVALACTDNYAHYCAETIVSLLLNSKENTFYDFYIIQDKLRKDYQERIIKLKQIKDFNINFIDIAVDENENKIMKNPMRYRLKLASMLPNLDKVIYSDCDVTFLGGLEELWNEDMDDYYIGACLEIFKKNLAKYFRSSYNINMEDYGVREGDFYYNSGMLLMNLKKIRNEGAEEKIIDFTKKYPEAPFLDQDAINLVFHDKLKPIPIKWNTLVSYNTIQKRKIDKRFLQLWKEAIKNPSMIHFAANKKPDKLYFSLFRQFHHIKTNKYKKVFWYYLSFTDWKDEKGYKTIFKLF
jgi:lipopolysaccharide biosynthesis glycosyltransferase